MKIVHYPNPILAHPSKPLQKIDSTLRDLVSEMFDLMYEAEGVGLAANQVELPYQLLVMNPSGDPENKEEEYVFLNPVITKRRGGLRQTKEGCLSFPELRLEIARHAEIEFQAVNLAGKLVRHAWKGLPARILQHEADHLNGICFYQKTTTLGEFTGREILHSLAETYALELQRGSVPNEAELAERIARWEQERT